MPRDDCRDWFFSPNRDWTSIVVQIGFENLFIFIIISKRCNDWFDYNNLKTSVLKERQINSAFNSNPNSGYAEVVFQLCKSLAPEISLQRLAATVCGFI
ncbi:hypothetical protein T07_6508 [Trichinella nelsoni]|uniref:Uncharacterized protein n=1 Tax=Trichinella nelsoni TaxID=6336 RepID=A0A0V0RG32_9BILA|nr:hypothetical protein T07_6508 [Trichinella nelsoni]